MHTYFTIKLSDFVKDYILPIHCQCKIDQSLCHRHVQGNGRYAVGIGSESQSRDGEGLAFRDRMNYTALTHLNGSSEHAGGLGGRGTQQNT